jgi:hypothetical protein
VYSSTVYWKIPYHPPPRPPLGEEEKISEDVICAVKYDKKIKYDRKKEGKIIQ